MKIKRIKGTSLAQLSVVLLFSLVAMLFMMGFDGHIFLRDDNMTEFYPIIDKSYNQFLRTGQYPVYDFFQQKGMIIADEGYYGQTNVLLFVSWLLNRYVFHNFDFINIYAVLCVLLGNVFWYCLFKRLKISTSVICITIAMLSASSTFFSFAYWYYVFNIYISIPMLIYGIHIAMMSTSVFSYILAGLSLTFSLTLGNVQYSLYLYIAYTVIFVSYILLSKNYKKLYHFISNLGAAIFLSLPLLLILLKASERRALFTNHEFFVFPVDFLHQFLFSFVPNKYFSLNTTELFAGSPFANNYDFLFNGYFVFAGLLFFIDSLLGINKKQFGILKRWIMENSVLLSKIFIVTLISVTYLTKNLWISLLFAIGLYCIAYFLYQIKNRYISTEQKYDHFTIGIFSAIVFFSIFEMGKHFIIADILGLIPVINQFRYLCKISFIIIPLLAIIAAAILEKYKKRWTVCIALFFVLVGLKNNYEMTSNGKHRWYNGFHKESSEKFLDYKTLLQEFEKNNIDLKNYRLMPIYTTFDYAPFGDYFDSRLLSSNISTMIGNYSAGGYEMAAISNGYRSLNRIFSNEGFDYRRTAGISGHRFFSDCRNNKNYAYECAKQISINSIKYFLIDKNSPYLSDFENFIEESEDLKLERKIILSNDTVVFSITGVTSLFEKCDVINSDFLDSIRIHPLKNFKKENIVTSFTFSGKLKAYAVTGDTEEALDIRENEWGNAVIENFTGDNDVVFVYKNSKKSFALLFTFSISIIIFLIFCGHSLLFLLKINSSTILSGKSSVSSPLINRPVRKPNR